MVTIKNLEGHEKLSSVSGIYEILEKEFNGNLVWQKTSSNSTKFLFFLGKKTIDFRQFMFIFDFCRSSMVCW